YTSGTTGKPKGAMLTHNNLAMNAVQCARMVQLSYRDCFMCLLPMFHSFAWTVCVLVPLYLGSPIVVVESVLPFGPVLRQIFRRRVKIFVAVPPIYAALLRVPFWRPLRWLNPVRLCISGAAALPGPILEAFEAKFDIPLLEGYGLTEASPVVTLNPERERRKGSVGKPLPGIDIRIVHDLGHDQPAGEVGEICVRGDNVMLGYYHHDEATQAVFLDEPKRWLRTGDLGFMDSQGYLHISDRKKDLIIVKGMNVYPKEVEDILLNHPAVDEAAVIGVRDETGDELIQAFVTLKPGTQADKTELMKLCRTRLAGYKCPKEIEIRTDLPKNTLGKILKRELRK
ncbi:MAG TPA: AMP-binding protein, partial [Elusimicrobiota bacterium]|nr:AMP-binding protein [Elusimicrobiota bacterium]